MALSLPRCSNRLLAVLLFGASCSQPLDDDPSLPSGPPENTEESLDALGVNLDETPRLGDDMQPLPESYSPLGSRRTVNRFDELALFQVDVDEDASTGPTATESPTLDFQIDGNNVVRPELLDAGASVAPWSADDTHRRAASGDFDGDGVDEVAVAYQTLGETLNLVIRDDAGAGFAIGDATVIGIEAVDEIFLAGADLDGDGLDDLILVTLAEGTAQATFLINRGDRFTPEGPSLNLGNGNHVRIEAGQLDYDAPEEFAFVVNEGAGRNAGDDSRARLYLYDDLPSGLTPLYSDLMAVRLPDEILNVRGGDVALADVDGDGLDEVVFGGLTALGRMCNLETYAVLEVWDDGIHGLNPIAANKVRFLDRRQPCSSGASHRISQFPIRGFDVDGDGAEEIFALQWVYDDLQTPEMGFQEIATLPQEEWLSAASSGSIAKIHWSTASWAVGDVTSDGREDLVYYTQRSGAPQVVQVWGIDMIDGWKRLVEVETAFENNENLRPQLLTADLDQDRGSMGLKYSAGSHELVFTAPVIIAALAAPPCAETSGQDLGACRTAFGSGTTEGETSSNGWSVIAGVSVGYGIDVSVAGIKVGSAEAVVNTRTSLRNYKTTAYRLRTQVQRQTGPLEDSVIFTSIPYDVYTYEILSHPNPDLVGDTIEVRLPREPITIMATAEFYNARVEPGGPRIDSSVFTHVVGDPSTYRSATEKDQLLRSTTGVESDEVDVGQGNGSTRVIISRFDSTTTGRKFQAEATLDLKATKGGVIGGFKIGGGFDFEFQTLRGTDTTYQGVVPNIPDGDLSNAYAFGLFAYLHKDAATGQSFEVLDYWVR